MFCFECLIRKAVCIPVVPIILKIVVDVYLFNFLLATWNPQIFILCWCVDILVGISFCLVDVIKVAVGYLKLAVDYSNFAVCYLKLAVDFSKVAVRFLKHAVDFLKVAVRFLKLADAIFKTAVVLLTTAVDRWMKRAPSSKRDAAGSQLYLNSLER